MQFFNEIFNAILSLMMKSFRLSLLDFACSFYYYLLIVVVLYGTSRPEFNSRTFYNDNGLII